MNDIEIKYNPEVVTCPYCGATEKASNLQERTTVTLGKSLIEKHAQNVKRWNELYEQLKNKQINAYAYFFENEKVAKLESKEKLTNSFIGEVEGVCKNCGTKLKADVSGTSTVEIRSELNQPIMPLALFRGLPLPEDKVLVQVLRSGESWISEDDYAELLKLKKDDTDERYNKRKEEIQKMHSPTTLEYIKEVLNKKQQNLEDFQRDVIAKVDSLEVDAKFKADFRTDVTEFVEEVQKADDHQFARFLSALQRWAKIMAWAD